MSRKQIVIQVALAIVSITVFALLYISEEKSIAESLLFALIVTVITQIPVVRVRKFK